MSLLSICQNASDEIGTGTRPASLIGSLDPDAQLFLRIANKVGEYLKDCAVWSKLRKERTFTGISGEEQTGILPDDFDRFVAETFWNRSVPVLMVGPIGAVRWQSEKANSYAGSTPLFALRGGSVFVIPALISGESLAFEYVTTEWCKTGATGNTAWATDDDTAVLSEELFTLGVIAGHYYAHGLPQYPGAAGAFQDRINLLLKNDQPTARVMVSADIFAGVRHWTGEPAASNAL
jgi:hypothetical protein